MCLIFHKLKICRFYDTYYKFFILNTIYPVCLLTGGSRGLGKDIALTLGARGIDLILTYHSKKQEALEVCREIEKLGSKAVTLPLDMADPNSYDRFLDEVRIILSHEFPGRSIRFLINNAGIGILTPYVQTTEEQFDLLMNIHFKGVFFLTQKVLPLMEDSGAIVNISSGTVRTAFPGYSAYASMKGAMEVLTRYQAKELGPRRIRVNIVAPGAVETDFRGGAVRDNPQTKAALSAQTPLGRVGLPQDIGGVVAFLCSEDARWINGQRLEVSGGINL